MSGIHGLQHVHGLPTSHFPYHDPIRTHSQGIMDQVSHIYLSGTIHIGKFRFQPDHVPLFEFQFNRIFDGYNTLFVWNETG